LTIREIIPTDAGAAAQLSAEFGYPVSFETMRRRITLLQHRHDHAIFIAHIDDLAVGWIDVGVVHHLVKSVASLLLKSIAAPASASN
jgi:hypothetical protein